MACKRSDGVWRGSRLPFLYQVEFRSFQKGNNCVDARFVDYLVALPDYDVWSVCAYKPTDVSRYDSLCAEVEKYDHVFSDPSVHVRGFCESAKLYVKNALTWSWASLPALRFLTPSEAFDTLDKSTSPGFPWRQYAHTKADLEDLGRMDDVYCRVAEVWESLAGDGSEIEHVWFAFLKGELRPVEKLERPIPAIRSICGSPVDLGIVATQLCFGFNEAFYACNENTIVGSAVGLSPYHGGWDRLHARMFRHPEYDRVHACSIDVSQWDRSFSPYLFAQVVEIREALMGQLGDANLSANAAAVYELYRSVVNSAVLVPGRRGSDVVGVRGGMKSGWTNTTVDNTLAHIIVVVSYLASLGLRDEIGRGVTFALYGDDNFIAWDDRHNGLINAEGLQSWYTGFGFTTHGIVVRTGDDRDGLVFLGGLFGVCPVTGLRVYKPEEEQKAVDAMRYGFKSYDQAFQRACALRLLHFYNKRAYEIADGYALSLLRSGLVSDSFVSNYHSVEMLRAVHTGHESGDDRLNSLSTSFDNPFVSADQYS